MQKLNLKIKYVFLLTLIFSITFFGVDQFVLAEDDELTEEEKEKIEKQEEKLEDEKDDIEDNIEKAEQKKVGIQQNLNVVQKSLSSTQQDVAETKDEIENQEHEIDRHNKEIKLLDNQTELYRKALASALRDVYFQQGEASIVLALRNEKSNKFLESADNFDSVREKVLDLIDKITETKKVAQKKKDAVKAIKDEKEDLLSLQRQQEKVLASEKRQAQTELVSAQATISELNSKLAAVESDISSLLGGSVDTDDIEEAAKFASKKTGVRKSFLLGMLIVETDLGRYTGGCTYKNSNMNDHRKKVFKEICEDLDYNYKKQVVSCPPANYKGTGGAMGVAQFMSDTWKGYESKISAKTGHNPPDPWNLTDGVMAMAIKLVNDGALNGESGECTAAKRYLGGNHQWYCDKVLYWADNYKDKL